MALGIIRRLIGSRNQRLIKSYQKTVQKINAFEPEFEALSDEALAAKTDEFKTRLADGEKLSSVLPEAFAVAREASKRTLGLRHFDVQMIGGAILNDGNIGEMATGEGKTLAATLPAYLNALTGRSVHIVTVNDYLARRDANWMRPLYEFLGLTVGVVVPRQAPEEKRAAYASDIVYGTNNEFGFDYLRDNMAFTKAEQFQGELAFAIVDEVDSILIDEARTPLIISGPTDDSSELYRFVNTLVPELTAQTHEDGPGDFAIDEKAKQVHLTETGHEHIERLMIEKGLLKEGDSLYSAQNIMLMHHLQAGLRAHVLFKRDVDYIVTDDEVIIVDEHTGRTMPGRRWSDGLHQAIEAKENVKIQQENQTLASITFQNYFRLYDKLAGMTGTADTEAYEFHQIYNLEVVVVPTNKPCQREDQEDLIYVTESEKFDAILEDIVDCQKRGQPVLVGTTSIENSERLSKLLSKEKIQHNVLNAKFHEKEAQIIAEAGVPGSVTLATNMAGRGTDIVLGGNLKVESQNLDPDDTAGLEKLKAEWEARHQKVVDAGGLRVIASERHESRRIDNQLRGRSGRQGDPGSSQFYLSLEDNLMRIFAPKSLGDVMRKWGGLQKGEPITARMVSRSIEQAQRRVEGFHFDMRKQLLDFDDVANEQRKVIYDERNALLMDDDLQAHIAELRADVLDDTITSYVPPQSLEEQWDIPGLTQQLESDFNLKLPIQSWLDEDDAFNEEKIRERILQIGEETYLEKVAIMDDETRLRFERGVLLQTLDMLWKEHLNAMDHLRQSVHLRGYAQKDPKQEYKREAFSLFQNLLDQIKRQVTMILMQVRVESNHQADELEEARAAQKMQQEQSMHFQHADVARLEKDAPPEETTAPDDEHTPFKRSGEKIGRNEPCPCGSGKKYKQCHGKIVDKVGS